MQVCGRLLFGGEHFAQMVGTNGDAGFVRLGSAQKRSRGFRAHRALLCRSRSRVKHAGCSSTARLRRPADLAAFAQQTGENLRLRGVGAFR